VAALRILSKNNVSSRTASSLLLPCKSSTIFLESIVAFFCWRGQAAAAVDAPLRCLTPIQDDHAFYVIIDLYEEVVADFTTS